MRNVVALVAVRYDTFLEQSQGGMMFYKNLVLDYKERFISEGIRGPIYRDDPTLKKGIYRVPEVFARANFFVFNKPEDALGRIVIKVVCDFSPLLDSEAGINFLKEKALQRGGSDFAALEQNRHSLGLFGYFYLGTNFELDLLRAIGLTDAMPNGSAAQNKKDIFVEQIRSALECYQFHLLKIEPERDISGKWGILTFIHYDLTPPPEFTRLYVIRALGALIR